MVVKNSSNGKVSLSEKGLLTPDNCVVAQIDLQPQMPFGVSNFDRQSVVNNNITLSLYTDFENFTVFKPAPQQEQAVSAMLEDLVAWGQALKNMRAQRAKTEAR